MGSTYHNYKIVSPMKHTTLFKQFQPSTPTPTMKFSTLVNGPGYGCKIVPRPIMCTATTTPKPLSFPMVDNRRSANYKPSMWNLEFLESLKRDQIKMQDNYDGENIDKVKETLIFEVRNMVLDEALEPTMFFQLIDEIERLSLGNEFGIDIERSLNRLACNFGDLKLDLHTTALAFRILRQNGTMVCQDVFQQFMDDKGSFEPSLCNDITGVISLYEASHIAYEGEHLLDEAKAFTSKYLSNLLLNEDKSIANQVNRALDLPIRYRMPKLEARHFIETYSTREDTIKNTPALLELAKLDFNVKQLMYQEDLQEMARWWKELGLSNNLSFARDRLMECFFWGTGTTPKPEHSHCRKALTKVYKFITIIDDIYDVYGYMDELELFTNAVERWDINTIDDLPDYMKLTFLALYNTINKIGYEILKQKGHNCVPFLKKAWEDMLKAFLVEAKWCHDKQTPTFEEYINNGWVSVSGAVALTHAYFFVSQDTTSEALDCLRNYHDILRLPSMIFRLSNDLATSEWEDMLKAFLVEAKWCHDKQTPTFEEYINNGWVSVSGAVALTHAYFFVSQDTTSEALDCLRNYHDILRLPSMIFRLSNDLATSEVRLYIDFEHTS